MAVSRVEKLLDSFGTLCLLHKSEEDSVLAGERKKQILDIVCEQDKKIAKLEARLYSGQVCGDGT